MINDISGILGIISMIVTIGGLFGGIFAFRNGITRTANEVQDRVITALQSELTTLQDKITDMKAENRHLSMVVETICSALKNRGLHITIDKDTVMIRDDQGGITATRIQEVQP